jgi:hypothetical protein
VDISVHAGSKKKSYQKPQLEVYGNLGDITQRLGNSGASDNSPSAKHTGA